MFSLIFYFFRLSLNVKDFFVALNHPYGIISLCLHPASNFQLLSVLQSLAYVYLLLGVLYFLFITNCPFSTRLLLHLSQSFCIFSNFFQLINSFPSSIHLFLNGMVFSKIILYLPSFSVKFWTFFSPAIPYLRRSFLFDFLHFCSIPQFHIFYELHLP